MVRLSVCQCEYCVGVGDDEGGLGLGVRLFSVMIN